MTIILSDSDVSKLVSPRKAVDACEQAYLELAQGQAATTTRRDLIFPPSGNDVSSESAFRFVTMEGGTLGLGVVTQRIDSEKVALKQEGKQLRQIEIPITGSSKFVGLIFLYSMKTGELLSIMNDGELGRMRVSATIAVGAKHMSRRDSQVLALYGAGWQAGAQIPAIAAVREIKQVRVYSPTANKRTEFCTIMSNKLGLDVQPVEEPQRAAKNADMIAAASSSRQPVCAQDWIQRGTHLSCIVPYEYDEETWNRADIIVSSQLGHGEFKAVGQTASFAPTMAGKLPFEKVVSKIRMLTDLLKGDFSGRDSESQTTLFYKGLGLGIEFAAVAKVAYDAAIKDGVGKEIPTDWFAQDSHT